MSGWKICRRGLAKCVAEGLLGWYLPLEQNLPKFLDLLTIQVGNLFLAHAEVYDNHIRSSESKDQKSTDRTRPTQNSQLEPPIAFSEYNFLTETTKSLEEATAAGGVLDKNKTEMR